MEIDVISAVRIVAATLQNLGLAVAIGSLLCGRWLLQDGGMSSWQDSVERRLRFSLRASVALLAVTTLPMAWVEAAVMGGTSLDDATTSVLPMLRETHYGHIWIAGTVVSVVLLILVVRHVRIGVGGSTLLLWVGLAAFASTKSASGHPAEAGTVSLPVVADWVHVLAISVWLGIVVVSALVVAPRMPGAIRQDQRLCASFVQSLSDTATIALVFLFLTGVYNGWRIVDTSGNLFHTAYGQTLLVKVALVAVCVALGGLNRFVEMPRLLEALNSHKPGSGNAVCRAFTRVLSLESVLLLGVLVTAALLVGSPPPGTS